MSIRLIDIAMMAPKSQEASQQKQVEVHKTTNEQTQIVNQFNQEIKHNSMQTVKTIKGENHEYRYDAKEKGNNSYSNQSKKKQKGSKESLDKKQTQDSSGNFDIMI